MADEDIEEYWDKVYKNYPVDEIPWQTKKPEKLLTKLLEKNKVKPGKVLDMCSGTGINSIYLAGHGFDVHGIDISPTAVDIANKECAKKGLSCRYVQGNVLTKKLEVKFDFVFDRGCFHHIENKDKPKYAKRVSDLLDENGKFFLQAFSDKNRTFWKNLSKEDIKRYFLPYFDIEFIEDTTHIEPDSGRKVYLYSVFMHKKN